MKKTIGTLLLAILCTIALVSCGNDAQSSSEGDATTESKIIENTTSEDRSAAVSITEGEQTEATTKKTLAPGIEGPEGWPEDVPTPLTGEFLWGDWVPDRSFYTVDIRYTQAEIDAYAERLQDAGFSQTDTDQYEDIYGDAGVYANDKWEIVLGDEGVNGDYTYMSLYPVE